MVNTDEYNTLMSAMVVFVGGHVSGGGKCPDRDEVTRHRTGRRHEIQFI